MSIINREHKFIFLKSHKTASSSIENFLIANTVLGNDIYYTSKEILSSGMPRSKDNRHYIFNRWGQLNSKLNRIPGINKLFPAILQHDTYEEVSRIIKKKL